MSYDFSKIGLEGIAAYDAHKLTQAQTAVQNMAALAKKQELDDAQKQQQLDEQAATMFDAIVKGNPPPQGDLVPDNTGTETRAAALRRMGDLMMKGGATERGKQLYAAADNMQKEERDSENDAATRQKNLLDAQQMSADLVYRYIGTARNQSEWENGLQYLMDSPALSQEEKQHLQTLPHEYTPALASFLADRAMSAKDQAQLKLTQQQRDVQAAAQQETAQYHANSLAVDRARLAEQKRKDELDQKTGKSSSAPTGPELDSVKDIVTNQIFAGVPPEKDDPLYGAYVEGSQNVAARAKQLVKDTPGIDWNTAVNRALIESQSNGDWTTITDKGWFSDTTKLAGYKKQGNSPDDAAPLPLSKESKPDPSQLVKGKYYMTVRGRALWDGKNFQLAPTE